MSSQTAEFQEVRSSTLGDRFVKSIHVLSKVWLALRVGGWLCVLPILVKIYSLPGLLERLSRKGRGNRDNTKKVAPFTLALPYKRRGHRDDKGDNVLKENIGMERAIGIVARVCDLRLFRLAIFPRLCLRQSLALYRTLNNMNYPVDFHLGVSNRTGKVLAHSWVTFEGRPVSGNAENDSFKIVYSYPKKSNSNGGSYERKRKSAAAG